MLHALCSSSPLDLANVAALTPATIERSIPVVQSWERVEEVNQNSHMPACHAKTNAEGHNAVLLHRSSLPDTVKAVSEQS